MSWRMRVRHSTGYRYDREVKASYNEARLLPQTGSGQLTLEATVHTSPPAHQQRYWDYWGTQVTSFDVSTPHQELEVVSESVVETADAVPAPIGVDWDLLRHPSQRDAHVELLMPSARTAPSAELAALAAEVTDGLAPLPAALAIARCVHSSVAYRAGSTADSTNASEAWRLGAGVCQDIAHVSLSMLRSVDIPARYVSGYLHPGGADAPIGEVVKGESHAWIEVWLGQWWGYDPTNDIPVGERHVVVARGRDYADVSPLKGIYSGGGSQSLGVLVEVTRLA